MKLTKLFLACSPLASLLVGGMLTPVLAEALLAQKQGSSNSVGNSRSIVIDSENVSGLTKYLVRTSGSIKPVEGNLNGHQVNIHPKRDNVIDNAAAGRVSTTKDGFRFQGEILEIKLSNPNAANVYVDGERRSYESRSTDRGDLKEKVEEGIEQAF